MSDAVCTYHAMKPEPFRLEEGDHDAPQTGTEKNLKEVSGMARILIADDSPTETKFIESVLAPTHHALSFASDGEEAENLVRNEIFDLLILDVVMPKKNGFQLCREIKKDENLRYIPIIILTSKNQESDKQWGARQGADVYLTKPCRPLDLLHAVKKCLGNEDGNTR